MGGVRKSTLRRNSIQIMGYGDSIYSCVEEETWKPVCVVLGRVYKNKVSALYGRKDVCEFFEKVYRMIIRGRKAVWSCSEDRRFKEIRIQKIFKK